jgi:hypothetical protein
MCFLTFFLSSFLPRSCRSQKRRCRSSKNPAQGTRRGVCRRFLARAAANPAAARIARRSSPVSAFLWKSRSAAAKPLIRGGFAGAYVSIG